MVLKVLDESTVPLNMYRISSKTNITIPVLKWHVFTLLKSNLIRKVLLGNMTYYKPRNYPICVNGLLFFSSRIEFCDKCNNNGRCEYAERDDEEGSS